MASLRYSTLVSRKNTNGGKLQVPRYYSFNIWDVYQANATEALITPIPESITNFGIGQFTCAAILGTGGTTEVFVTLDNADLIESERAANVLEGSSQVVWFKVGDNTTNTTGLFTFNTPFTYMKIRFNGTSGGRLTLSLI